MPEKYMFNFCLIYLFTFYLYRVREVDKEQTEGLIGINSNGGRNDS